MIHQAARYGRNDIIGFLFSQNVDVNKRELDVNFTPLMTAINEDMYHSAIYLINIGADVNLKDKDGNTALHYAVLMKSPLTILTLIQKGADINARDKDGLAPRDIAKFNGFYDELVTPYL
jgi:ankyrin repeat protein